MNDGLGRQELDALRKDAESYRWLLKHGNNRKPGGYTADQMRDYALVLVAAERERCAKLCEDWASVRTPEHGGLALLNMAERIRSA